MLDNIPMLPDKADVLSRIGHWLLIAALLSATGAHWAVLQSVAWATMLADNARVAPLPEALEKTFDGKHPCALCKQIANGRQSEKKSDTQIELKKLEFIRQAMALTLVSPAHFPSVSEFTTPGPCLTRTPPVPPPRPFRA